MKKIINIVLDTIAVLILLAGLGAVGLYVWFISLFIDPDWGALFWISVAIAFVMWRLIRWDTNA